MLHLLSITVFVIAPFKLSSILRAIDGACSMYEVSPDISIRIWPSEV